MHHEPTRELADVRPAPSHEIAEQLGALRSLRNTIDIRVAVLLGVDFDVIASALHRLALTEARVKLLEDELAAIMGQPLPVVHHYAGDHLNREARGR